jgi:hypothetical protein
MKEYSKKEFSYFEIIFLNKTFLIGDKFKFY